MQHWKFYNAQNTNTKEIKRKTNSRDERRKVMTGTGKEAHEHRNAVDLGGISEWVRPRA